MTDPIADFLTRIRNAVKANHLVVGFHRVSNSCQKIRNWICHNDLEVKN